MLLQELLAIHEEQLTEISAKRVIAAGVIAASALGIYQHFNKQETKPIVQVKQPSKLELEVDELSKKVLAKFKTLNEKEVKAIVTLAKKYEKPGFPRAQDILAIISIESSFNPNAVSGLRVDPAVGLMQVRPNVWSLNATELKADVDFQIESGAHILHHYFKKYQNAEDAVKAFNIGETAFRKMSLKVTDKHEAAKNMKRIESADRYVDKFKDAKSHFTSI